MEFYGYLKYLTLWKFGGIYLDLDVVVVRSFENLPPNYAGAYSEQEVAAGILNFNYAGIGHNLATQCLHDFHYNIDDNRNGSKTITRLSKHVCATEEIRDMSQTPCIGGFRVYPPKLFYPVSLPNWMLLFNESTEEKVDNLIQDSYMVHTWLDLSKERKIPVGDNVSYSILAKRYCPEVFNLYTDFF